MDFMFDESLAREYTSSSQKIRVMSEAWVESHLYCPACGNSMISGMKNNLPVADFQCDNCGTIYELKSKKGRIGRRISDGAYDTMISRITSLSNPDLFVLQYTEDYIVDELSLIPKFFFTPGIIEKRKALSASARRAGWVGCNIIYNDIPQQGKIQIIKNREFCDKDSVLDAYRKVKQLQTDSISNRGWLLDVLNCVNDIECTEFSLAEVYEYVDMLQVKHISNNNVEAKIRQQLQLLRDKGFIEFCGHGKYRKKL